MLEINDEFDPLIEEFTRLRDSTLNERGLILAESEKLFLQYIASGKKILKILATPDFIKRYSLHGENIFTAQKKVLEKIAGFKIHYEVIFLAEKPKDFLLHELDDKIILLNGLTSPENVGAIVRSAAAFNVNSIIADEKSCSPFLRRCIRVSMGNIFSMKTFHAKSISHDLKILKNLGYTIISTAHVPGAIDLKKFFFPQKCVLIIGSEGHGVDKDILEFSDIILKIKINSQVAHLNASNAAAIFLSYMNEIT